ncbi:HAD family hydrolase [Clostridium sp. LIBA-8841]|uniref:HAD family hydrolase n=1 Tax=Clostridium sp. LIBA-8841 TaxID=2987530 RepID=UPI002AC5B76B|nr:HAD family hydrolase [Clostridium sp. LIBA-8841]MDZ5253948.1 HAD family hydrolase [Clostridium sp. LIBA-8841]
MDLFVSDLDGTLLNKDQIISDYSKRELNKLINTGVNFAIATARSPATVSEILEGINIKTPVVLMNGVMIFDVENKKYIDVKEIDKASVKEVIKILEEYNKTFFLYGIKDDYLWVYHKDFTYDFEKEYYEERCNKPLKSFKKVESYLDVLEDNQIVNFVFFENDEAIAKELFGKIMNVQGVTGNCYKDIYNDGAFFLDIYNKDASKANGIKFLADYVEHSKVITFGDGENDVPMFEIADECYALENASDDLKAIATEVIGNNNDDAVVKFLIERLK